MSIQSQAMFWKNNVCDITDSMVKECGISHELAVGMSAFSDLLRMIYSDYEAYETSAAESAQTKIGIKQDDLENYHNLTDTALCLYGFANAGTVEYDGVIAFLIINKAEFKKIFKKPVSKFLSLLARYEFFFQFYRQGNPVKTYSSADTFEVYYERNNELLPAMKYLSDHLPQTDVKKDYAPSATIFLTADYNSMVMQRSTSRRDFSPVHPSILNTLMDRQEIWKKTVRFFCQEIGLQTDISVNTYVFPNWIVKFIHNKKTVCTFHIQCNQIYLRLPLSYEVAKEVIDIRHDLPQNIQNAIQSFGCVGCGKCIDRSNLERYNGFNLCTLSYKNFTTEDSRMIQFVLTQEDELTAVCNIVRKLVN